MEMAGGSHNLIVDQLGRGKELAEHLHRLLQSSDTGEMRRILLDEILFTFSKARDMVSHIAPEPPSAVGGCSSGHGDRARPFKRRKTTVARRSVTVKLSSDRGEGLEPSDGYSWRKYGSKIILGAQFKRGYYRCTYSRSQGCLALKIVQRCNEDQSLFQVTYVDDHTCTESSHVTQPTSFQSMPPVHSAPMHDHFHQPHQQLQVQVQLQQAASPILPEKTVELDSGAQEKFYFRSLSLSTRILDAENDDLGIWLPTASPEMPDSDGQLSSPARMIGACTEDPDVQKSVSTPNSVMNSPFDDVEFSLDELGIDTDFSFDNPELFH